MKDGFLFKLEPAYFRLAHAARYSGLTVSMLRQLINQPVASLPHIRVSRGTVLISRADLDAYLVERTCVGPEVKQAGEPPGSALVREFVATRCVTGPGRSGASKELYTTFLVWAATEADRELLAQRAFGMCLTALGFRRGKGAGGKRLWRGVGLSGVD